MLRRRFIALLAAVTAVPRVFAQGRKTMQNSELDNRIARLRRAFAPPAQAPQLLLDLARWLETPQAGDLPFGDHVDGDGGEWVDRLSDFWVEEGSDLAEQFGIFMGLGEGSDIALWNRGGPSETWPVVLIGGEGEAGVLADDLAGFLARIALADFESGSEPDGDGYSWLEFQAGEEYESEDQWDSETRAGVEKARRARKALGEWLVRTTGSDLAALRHDRTPANALRELFDAHQKAVLARRAADQNWHEVVRLFKPFAKRGKASWSKELHIVCAGDEFHIGKLNGRVFEPFAEAKAIEAPLRALREARAERQPSQGLWFSATLRGTGDGEPDLIARYLNPLDEYIAAPRPSAEAVRADCKRKPRSDWWTPPWLRQILG